MTLLATLRSDLAEMGWGSAELADIDWDPAELDDMEWDPAELDDMDWGPAEFNEMGWVPAELDETNTLLTAPTAAELLHTQQVVEAMMPDLWDEIEKDLSEASRRTPRRLLRSSLHRTVSGH